MSNVPRDATSKPEQVGKLFTGRRIVYPNRTTYKGVCIDKGGYKAQITASGISKNLGRFMDLTTAAIFYDRQALVEGKSDLNFPDMKHDKEDLPPKLDSIVPRKRPRYESCASEIDSNDSKKKNSFRIRETSRQRKKRKLEEERQLKEEKLATELQNQNMEEDLLNAICDSCGRSIKEDVFVSLVKQNFDLCKHCWHQVEDPSKFRLYTCKSKRETTEISKPKISGEEQQRLHNNQKYTSIDGYPGVSIYDDCSFISTLIVEKKRFFLGLFKDKERAFKAVQEGSETFKMYMSR